MFLAAVMTFCTLQDERITESSGLAAVGGLVYTVNDSGHDPVVFALDERCRTVGAHPLRGARNVDWEDLAAGPDGTLYVADIGDNDAERTDGVVLYVLRAPGPGDATVTARAMTMRYETGPRDAEALLVHPVTGSIHVVTKTPFGAAVYEARDGVLRRGPSLTFVPTDTPGGPDIGVVANLVVTGGAVAARGDRVALRTYTDLYEWPVTGGDVLAALRDGSPLRTPLPETRQGEAVTYSPDGASLLVSTEGEGGAVHRVRSALPPAKPAPSQPAVSGQATGTPQADAAPSSADEGWPWWPAAVGAGLLAAGGALLRARRRRSR